MFKWLIPDWKYLDYLRNNCDSRIPYTDYGANAIKPFFGSLFTAGDFIYITQISHPQQRHDSIKENLDFVKLYHPNSGELMAVININFMFPIHISLVAEMKYKDIGNLRAFSSSNERTKYVDLLRIELDEINRKHIGEAAIKVYNIKKNYPCSSLAKRCLDFSQLEQMCNEYMRTLC